MRTGKNIIALACGMAVGIGLGRKTPRPRSSPGALGGDHPARDGAAAQQEHHRACVRNGGGHRAGAKNTAAAIITRGPGRSARCCEPRRGHTSASPTTRGCVLVFGGSQGAVSLNRAGVRRAADRAVLRAEARAHFGFPDDARVRAGVRGFAGRGLADDDDVVSSLRITTSRCVAAIDSETAELQRRELAMGALASGGGVVMTTTWFPACASRPAGAWRRSTARRQSCSGASWRGRAPGA